MSVVRYDQGTWPDKAEMTAEGFLRVDAPITRMGVLQYRNPDGSMRGELRHPEDWSTPAAMASFSSLPITDGHPPPRPSDGQALVDARNAKKLAIGWTGESVRAEGDLLRVPMMIVDGEGVASVQRGRRGTSTGVIVDLKAEQGTYDGQNYSFRQTNPKGNHIAIVDSPRAGTMIRLDSNGNQLADSEDTRMVKVMLDGISYDAAPEVANALTKANAEMKELQTRVDAAEAEGREEADRLRAERDTFKERCDELEKRDVRADVRARVSLETSARKILPETEHERLDSMSDAEIRKAVVAAKWPSLKLDDKSEQYIATRFDIAIEEQGQKAADDAQHQEAIAHQRQQTTPRADANESPLEAAAKRAMERISNQWKTKAVAA